MSAEPSAAPAPETTEVTNDSNPAPVENQAAEDGTNPTVAEDKAEEKAEEKPEEKTEEKAEDKVEEKAEENAEEKAEEPKEDEQVKEDAKEDKEASPAKPPSSKAKKAGRPATKPRSSVGPASKKAGAASTSNGDKSFKIGDTVLARLKGYPAWPARIANPDELPTDVAKTRPPKSTTSYCAQYYPKGDYSWLQARDLSPLSKADIEKFLNEGHRKVSGLLREAYETAQDPADWISGQDELRAKRLAAEDEAEDVDQLEDEDDDAQAGSKRKSKAPAKKTAKKAKSTKADADEKPKAKAAKPKAAAKSKEPESKAEAKAPVDDDPLASDPECVKVKDWRHKLQRAFLGKGLPTEAEIGTYDEIFKTIENYKGMTIEALQYSKIGKVMKKIATLDSIPKNDELKLTDRAQKLMNDWQDFINKNGGEEKMNGSNGDATKDEAKPAEEDDKMEVEGQ